MLHRDETGKREATPAGCAPEAGGELKRRKKRMWDIDGSGNEVPNDPPAAAGAHAQIQIQQKAMMTAVMQQQAALTRRARRLHVGNLPSGLEPEALKELFNSTMRAAKLTIDDNLAAGCVNNISMATDNRFCFVEFRTAFECSNALALDQMQLLGKPLRVARPNDYAPAPDELETLVIAKEISDTVTSSTVPSHAMLCSVGTGTLAVGSGNHMGTRATPSLGMAATPFAANLVALQQQSRMMAAKVATSAQATGAATSLTLGGTFTSLSSVNTGANGGLQLNNVMSLSRRARRLHVGNLPTSVGLTASKLKQFFNAALVSANLHDTSKPGEPVLDCMLGSEGKFGFVEFRTIAEATACMVLNNIELGGKQLRIERPRDYHPMPESMHGELNRLGVMGNTLVAPDSKDILNPETHSAAPPLSPRAGAAADAPLLPPLAVGSATPVLALKNLVTMDDLSKPNEMADILDDTKSECDKHGLVVAAISPKPGAGGPPGSGLEEARIGLHVLVRFATATSALICAKELHGKQFDGRTVVVNFMSEETFEELQALPCFV